MRPAWAMRNQWAQGEKKASKQEPDILFESHSKTNIKTQVRWVISDCGTTLEAVDRPH